MRVRWWVSLSCVLLAAQTVRGQGADRAVFTAKSDLVVLHVTATNRRGAFVSGLSKDAFHVAEDGRPQTIEFFRQQDAPVTVGLVVDGSGSMLQKRELVIAAIAAFAEESHPDDEFFAVAFNERVTSILPPTLPFTGDPSVLRDAMFTRFAVRGRTALHDAVLAALDHVVTGSRERKVLILVSDGGDNASVSTEEDMVARAQSSNVVFYGVAVVDPLERDKNPKLLRRLAEATGGRAFEPPTVDRMGEALHRINQDIRSSYTLAYAPAARQTDGQLRKVRVTARTPDGERVTVRTRAGYLVASPRSGHGSAR